MAAGMMMIQAMVMVPCIIGWIIFLVALWRGMKAHESIAETMGVLAGGSP